MRFHNSAATAATILLLSSTARADMQRIGPWDVLTKSDATGNHTRVSTMARSADGAMLSIDCSGEHGFAITLFMPSQLGRGYAIPVLVSVNAGHPIAMTGYANETIALVPDARAVEGAILRAQRIDVRFRTPTGDHKAVFDIDGLSAGAALVGKTCPQNRQYQIVQPGFMRDEGPRLKNRARHGLSITDYQSIVMAGLAERSGAIPAIHEHRRWCTGRAIETAIERKWSWVAGTPPLRSGRPAMTFEF